MRKKGGFTLIELLVVIAIIALLAAIIFPVFSQVRRKSYQTTCLSNLRQIGIATLMYAQDYDDQLPWAGDPSDVNGAWVGSPDEELFKGMKTQHEILFPYAKNNNIWKCPADIGTDGSGDENEVGVDTRPAKPTSFFVFGTSYYTRTSIMLKRKPISSLEAFYNNNSAGGVSSVGYYFDAVGYWHGGEKIKIGQTRYNVAYLDGHAKGVGFFDYSHLWAIEIR
jgi:prepilin-type N-terminal cleavage/methylation domain-containing protein/prepilin-type processing-associated H-X9-DG protein